MSKHASAAGRPGRGAPRDPARERFWRGMLRRWADSGLSIRWFCRRRRLAESAFYFWRRELRRRDAAAARARRVPWPVGRTTSGSATVPTVEPATATRTARRQQRTAAVPDVTPRKSSVPLPAACPVRPVAWAETRAPTRHAVRRPPVAFAQVLLHPPAAAATVTPAADHCLRLRLAGGHELLLPTTLAPAYVARLLRDLADVTDHAGAGAAA